MREREKEREREREKERVLECVPVGLFLCKILERLKSMHPDAK